VSTTPAISTLQNVTQVHLAYASLMQCASACGQPTLGGQLFYVGELDDAGRGFAVAANIAGAATLSASAQPAAQRQAQREGAIDFLVNSLEEALRILKNEIRKCDAVAVSVSLAPVAIETEMIDRGVLPNLVRPDSEEIVRSLGINTFLSQGAKEISAPILTEQRLLIWAAPDEYAQNLAGFEAMLAEHLAPNDNFNRRWLRLSPRYLGPAARRLRSVACDNDAAAALVKLLGPTLSA